MIQNLPTETLKIHRHNQSLWSIRHRLHHDVHFTRFTCSANFTLQGAAGEELLQKQIYFWNEEKADNWDWRFPLMLWKISSRDKTFPSTSIKLPSTYALFNFPVGRPVKLSHIKIWYIYIYIYTHTHTHTYWMAFHLHTLHALPCVHP